MEEGLAAWGLAAELALGGGGGCSTNPGQEPVLATAVLKAVAVCLPSSGPLRAFPTASRPSSALECYLILGKLLSVWAFILISAT